MKTQTLQEKIMQQLMYFTITKMKHEKLLDKIMKAIQQEVRECIGKHERQTQKGDWNAYIEKCARNELRSDIQTKLKEKGLL